VSSLSIPTLPAGVEMVQVVQQLLTTGTMISGAAPNAVEVDLIWTNLTSSVRT